MTVVPVIMCGGSGTRLWPASKPERPKQFVPLTGDLSSFQETVQRVTGLANAVRPLVVAGIAHGAAIRRQLAEIGAEADVLLEPEPRDSAAAMAAAAVWIEAKYPDAVAVVVSADHHVPDAVAFRAAADRAAGGAREGRIVTLGVRPSSPSSAYGYLRPAGGEGVQELVQFVEKPDAATAARYIEQGYLWNSGNFVVAANVLIDELAAHAPAVLEAARAGIAATNAQGVLGDSFRGAPKISIDYAVMERTARASVLPVDFEWSDVGAWDAVLDASSRDLEGNSASGDVILLDSVNTYVRAPAGLRVAAVGVADIAIVSDGEALLVCDLARSQVVKQAAELSKARGPVRRNFADLAEAWAWYERWLKTSALPLWWSVGVDHDRGGFVEALNVEGEPRPAPRRGRVQGRQVYVFTTAGALGWSGPWRKAAVGGLHYALTHFRRADGLFRTLVSPEGAPLDDAATVYDQAFGLLALASLERAGGVEGLDLVREAASILNALQERRSNLAGFVEVGNNPYQSNCHMHLFEAALAWIEAGQESWFGLADELGQMALDRFIDPVGGFVREFFDPNWSPAAGDDGRLVEPGHQFEWAWLLARWSKIANRADARQAAERLFECGRHGVDARGIACNALWDDLTVRDPEARLWPQTEYLKAALILGRSADALAAANGLKLYLETPTAGVWFDKLRPDGTFVDELVPASSFYHVICSLAELRSAASVQP
ncbi:AGE family epimerase/isomerase [Phenylobacterium conjunctum]|uniref:AGE family epimerase/isomerase n=1 Tax=Phenylobacterium conjunctum TaxID=1298959 RepID=A0ABW3T4L5_9CAUL